MAKLRHVAIMSQDPKATAQFYIDAFGLKPVRDVLRGDWGHAYELTDGTINVAIIKFTTDEAAGVERGKSYVGLHHLGFEVDDVHDAVGLVERAGGKAREDINRGLGKAPDPQQKGEFKFEGPEGVVFDIAPEGQFKLTSVDDDLTLENS